MKNKNAKNHLLWRAGFGLAPHEWQAFETRSLESTIDSLFEVDVAPIVLQHAGGEEFNPKRMSREQRKEQLKKERQHVISLVYAWMERMANPSKSPLLERMSLFWHGHFACTSKLGRLAVSQLNTIRTHALGNFKDLLVGMAQDPSMIRFLNNQQNRKQQPNENFARELMELFTLGRGHYTENDIKEAARAFTGWSSDFNGHYIFRPIWHDYGQKTFFGQKGNFDGTDIIDLILEKPQTAQFIARKVYRYFVNDHIDEEIVAQLGRHFYQSNYNIESLMRYMFNSEWFYDPLHIGAKIKSPVTLMVGMMRTLSLVVHQPRTMVFALKALGQVPFNPPNVAGWPGGKHWIDNATLMLRLNLPFYLFNQTETNIRGKDNLKAMSKEKGLKQFNASIDLSAVARAVEDVSISDHQSYLEHWMLQAPAGEGSNVVRHFANQINDHSPLAAKVGLIMALPAYQLC